MGTHPAPRRGSANTSTLLFSDAPPEIRIQKDIQELELGSNMTIDFPNGADDMLNFVITMRPDEGLYSGGTFQFTFEIPSGYPHTVPKVHCDTKVYHPNIDLEGNICLNILREDWVPILNINAVVYGLQFLFLEPNPDDPLNKDAATVMIENYDLFCSNVAKALRGGYVDGEYFDNAMG